MQRASILPQSMRTNRYWNRCSCSLMCLHSMICCRQICLWIFERHQLALSPAVTMIRFVCVRANMRQGLIHSFFRLILLCVWTKCARIVFVFASLSVCQMMIMREFPKTTSLLYSCERTTDVMCFNLCQLFIPFQSIKLNSIHSQMLSEKRKRKKKWKRIRKVNNRK